jgi:hypothetical protein
MALKTRAKFFYGFKINTGSNFIAFQEASGPVKTATLKVATYSAQGFANEISRALNEAGIQNYSASFSRINRKLTISCSGTFSLLIASGPFAGSQIYADMGFDLVDLSGSNSYTAQNTCGKEYIPQFFLLDYVSTDNSQEAVDASINETASGAVEVIRYGIKKFMKCTIDYITNEKLPNDSWIENSQTAVDDAQSFLQDITQKNKIEFMPDREDPSSFQVMILESTPSNRNGLGYELQEKAGFDEYYTTGRLVFRLIE